MRISCKHREVINDGLEVGDFSQHGNFAILQNKSERGVHFFFIIIINPPVLQHSSATCGTFVHIYITLLFVLFLVYFTIRNRGGCYRKINTFKKKKMHQNLVGHTISLL